MSADPCKPMSRRALLVAGVMLPTAAIAAPASRTHADPAAVLAQEWLTLDDVASAAVSDADIDALGDQQSEIGRRLMNTPATTVAGLCGKLAVLARFLGADLNSEYFDDGLLLAALADAKALEQVGH